MNNRTFIAILDFDEELAAECDKTNGNTDTSPGDYLEREIGRLRQIGISLEDWALVDYDVAGEQYLMYLARWAIEHNDGSCMSESPLSYNDWKLT